MVATAEKTSFDLLGKRWSALIVRDLIHGPRRFREILHDLGHINDKVLSQRLKELEAIGIIKRELFAEVPVRVEYTLTSKGQSLARVIGEMEHWDAAWVAGAERPAALVSLPAEQPLIHDDSLVLSQTVMGPKLVPNPEPAVAPVAVAMPAPAPQLRIVEKSEALVQAAATGTQGEPQRTPFWRRFGL